jgi:hypothetical protein
MSETAVYRLSLLVALCGTLLMLISASGQVLMPRLTRNMPLFEQSSPAIPDWPLHQHLPIG